MKVVFAPDKFAGTLTAAEAAAAMARGWRRTRPDDSVVELPMADGGEGTVAVVAAHVRGAQRHEVEVADARGLVTSAAWLLLPDATAVVEAAQACGLRLRDGDPTTATTYGVGQLIRAAVAAGAQRVVVGLGGTATVDGGAGAATALGARLRRSDGNGVKVGARHLESLARVEPAPALPVEVVAAADVANPLLGPDGAARVFGPQKGASPDDVELLEAVLTHFADVVERDIAGGPWRQLPFSGAAGGLGFGLAAFAGATLRPGVEVVGDLVGLDALLSDADVVVTGEGSLDDQSRHGKVPLAVAARAVQVRARRMAIAGRITTDVSRWFERAVDLGPQGPHRAAALVEEKAAQLAAELAGGR